MTTRYSTVAIWLHWAIGLAIIGNIVGGLTFDTLFAEGTPARGTAIGIHKSLGLTVIALTLVRIGWRLANPPPPLPSYLTVGERLLARATHIGFYALMLALPLSGWAMVSTGTRPLNWFWLFDVPKLPLDKGLRPLLGDVHEMLGWIGLATVALHVAAVVKHKVMDRDNLLARMLPARG